MVWAWRTWQCEIACCDLARRRALRVHPSSIHSPWGWQHENSGRDDEHDQRDCPHFLRCFPPFVQSVVAKHFRSLSLDQTHNSKISRCLLKTCSFVGDVIYGDSRVLEASLLAGCLVLFETLFWPKLWVPALRYGTAVTVTVTGGLMFYKELSPNQGPLCYPVAVVGLIFYSDKHTTLWHASAFRASDVRNWLVCTVIHAVNHVCVHAHAASYLQPFQGTSHQNDVWWSSLDPSHHVWWSSLSRLDADSAGLVSQSLAGHDLEALVTHGHSHSNFI